MSKVEKLKEVGSQQQVDFMYRLMKKFWFWVALAAFLVFIFIADFVFFAFRALKGFESNSWDIWMLILAGLVVGVAVFGESFKTKYTRKAKKVVFWLRLLLVIIALFKYGFQGLYLIAAVALVTIILTRVIKLFKRAMR